MLFQEIGWTRLITVIIAQSIVAAVFLFLSFKVLKRKRTRLSFICTGIFLPIALAFIINLIYLPLRLNPLVFVLYIITFFLILLANIFILLFNINLAKSKFEFTLKKQLFLFVVLSIVAFLILLIPGGIRIDESTNWSPIWNLFEMVVVLLFATICLIVPSLFFSLKIYKIFQDVVMKKKWRFYLIGYIGLVFSFLILLIFYVTTDPLLRTVLSTINLVIIPSGFLMYLGLGRQLEQ